MVPPKISFNIKDIADLNEDLRQSPKALRAITQRVLTLQLRKLRNEMRGAVPVHTGKLRASLGSSVRKSTESQGGVWAIFGFLRSKRVSAASAIAANVLQHPGATAKKRAYLWIPTLGNLAAGGGAQITPQQFFNLPSTFIRTVPSGKKLAFQRINDTIVPLFVLKNSALLSAPPLPIESRVEGQLPEITSDIQETISQVLEARGAAVRAVNGGQ